MKQLPVPPVIGKYLEAWLARPKLFGHPVDESYFFTFVKACRRYANQQRNGHWLKYHLGKREISKHWIDKAGTWFDILMDYEGAIFPRSEIEM